ncbi:MAG: RICIN domain-containing protein [Oscillospiraceae bacterium]|nr:RICIN domain-containing protein [Oscillospiraceae bacterium]
MYTYLFFGLLSIVLLFVLAFGQRMYHGYQKKRNTVNTYGIQNIQTGKNLRVRNASIGDEVKIILYTHHIWECMTWQMIRLDGDTYLLKNLYTKKTFQPSSSPQPGVPLWQQPLGGSSLQYWEFLKQPDETYLIRLSGTELYITVSSDKNNSDIVLRQAQGSDTQKWKLIGQHPVF